MNYKAILIKSEDNIATAMADLSVGEEVAVKTESGKMMATINEPILFGHKFAIKNINKGEDIIKYGEVMGRATQKIEAGMHAHIQNIESLRGRGDKEEK